MPILDGEHIGRPDPQDKPLDFVADCSAEHCRERIYFGDVCYVDEHGDYFCSEYCYVRGTGGAKVKAGMEELA